MSALRSYLRDITRSALGVSKVVLVVLMITFGVRWIGGEAPVSVAAGIKAAVFLVIASLVIGFAVAVVTDLENRVVRRFRR